jgi:ribosomal protein L15E
MGVTVPDVKEQFDISHLGAWRALQRLVKQNRLYVVGSRRRELLFEAGRGAIIYKARVNNRQEDQDGEEGSDDGGDEAGGTRQGAPAQGQGVHH